MGKRKGKSQESVRPLGSVVTTSGLWRPDAGHACQALARELAKQEDLSVESFEDLKRSALRILSQASPPNGVSSVQRTGIVVGRVQSGKTMSMTAVAALAHDNGYRIVIVLAGVTKILMGQSRDRFADHLRPEASFEQRWWMTDSETPASLSRELHKLHTFVEQWRNPDLEEGEKPTLFITVMKNHAHLKRLATLLERVDLKGIPALIIDDEADQAGLNTMAKKKNRVSSTHRYIAGVRAQLPHHTYLQYTATPQAPLLISLIDMLSPEFAVVLEPGPGYAGGNEFFGQGSKLVNTLPSAELFDPGEPPMQPPDGLVEAIAEFYVGVAAFAVEDRLGPWSMLIHPSQLQDDHHQYVRWVEQIQKEWASELMLAEDDPDRVELMDLFHEAHLRLRETDASLPAFADVTPWLRRIIAQTSVTELNSESGNEVPWKKSQIHVLVGGEKLNRGFTIKGLTVTYMPRNAGGWNADTIQQRARFFGYKGKYLERCRAYLHPDVLAAYQAYVEHEEHIRQQLREWDGKPLKAWKRAFFLDARLRPTRGNVLRDPFYRVKTEATWLLQLQPHDAAIKEGNTKLVDGVLAGLTWRTFEKRHQAAEVPLKTVLEELLVEHRVVGHHDIKWMYAARVMLQDLLEREPGAEVLVLKMDKGNRRTRSTTDDEKIKQLQQGRDKTNFGDYPGDRSMRDKARVTLQIHRLAVKQDNAKVDATALALYIPMKASAVLVKP